MKRRSGARRLRGEGERVGGGGMADSAGKGSFATIRAPEHAEVRAFSGAVSMQAYGRFPLPRARGCARGILTQRQRLEGGGGRSFLRAPGPFAECVTPRSRQGLGSESDQGSAGGPGDGWSLFTCKWALDLSAGQLGDRADEVLVAGVGVDRGGQDRGVAGETLRQSDVPGRAVDAITPGVAKRVDGEAARETCALLPDAEEVAQLTGRQAVALAASKEGSVRGGVVAIATLVGEETLELRADGARQDHLLGAWANADPLEDTQLNTGEGSALVIEDVAEGEQFVGAQACGEGEADQDVIAEAVAVFPGDAQEALLLAEGGRLRGLSLALGVVGHGSSSMEFRGDAYTLCPGRRSNQNRKVRRC